MHGTTQESQLRWSGLCSFSPSYTPIGFNHKIHGAQSGVYREEQSTVAINQFLLAYNKTQMTSNYVRLLNKI